VHAGHAAKDLHHYHPLRQDSTTSPQLAGTDFHRTPGEPDDDRRRGVSNRRHIRQLPL
ncbi:unnamed protein product, partial [Ectocarpus sp. 8 AP-2014]